jgi:AcrR family transcriptional regulator
VDVIRQQSSPKRRQGTAGYPAGDDARQRLLSVASEVFAERGFEAASTREIARRADMRSPALTYYFGDKLGLYLACVDVVTNRIGRRIDPLLCEMNTAIEQGADTPALIDLYCRLQDSLLDSFFARGEGDAVKELIWNVRFEIPEATDMMNERVSVPIHKVSADIIRRVIGAPDNDIAVALHVTAVAGTYMNFYLNKRPIAQLLQWDMEQPERGERIKDVARHAATCLLRGLAERAGTWPDGSGSKVRPG